MIPSVRSRRQFVGQVANLPFARQVGNLPHELLAQPRQRTLTKSP